jgi:transposase
MTDTHGGMTMRLIQIRDDELAELEAIVARQAAEPGDWRRAREILAAVPGASERDAWAIRHRADAEDDWTAPA